VIAVHSVSVCLFVGTKLRVFNIKAGGMYSYRFV